MGSRIYVGNLSSRTSERDLEHFFKSFGRIKDVMMKSGFGFVEFDDPRDADDAIHEQNGRELMGNRVVVELTRRRFGYGRRDGGGYGGRDDRGYRDRDGVMTRDGRVNGRFPPPMQTRFRMIVTNLSTRCSWQDIKDMMRMDGKVNVTYADAHKRARNEALLCFASHDDLRYAMDKFQGKEINGRRIKIVDDTEGDRSGGGRRGRSRSRSQGSRSRSRSSHRSRSRSRSGGRRSRSRSVRRSLSRSPPSGRSRSRSNSSKGSRAKNGVGSRTPEDKASKRSRSRSRSASAASSKSGGRGESSPKKQDMED